MKTQSLLSALLVCLPMAAHAAPELIRNGSFQDTTTQSTNGNFQLTATSSAATAGSYGSVASWYTQSAPSGNPYNLLFRTTAKTDNTSGNAGAAQTNNATTTPYSPSAPGSGVWGQYSSDVNTAANSAERLAAGYNKTSPVGGNFMALDGDSGVRGALSQDVTGLTAGVAYTLTFYWAVAELLTGQPAPDGLTESLKVSLGSSSLSTATVKIQDGGFSGWFKESFTFIASTTGMQTLSFLSVGTPSGAPPFALLDGVSLTAAPEPATWATMAVGLLGLAGAVRFRRRAGGGSAAA